MTSPKLGKQCNYGDLFTVEEFDEDCRSGMFNDYDGHGRWATENGESDIIVVPSTRGDRPDWATHVMWFNK